MEYTPKTKMFIQVGGLLFMAGVLAIFSVFILRALELPFRAVNDRLHEKGSFIVLDFLIPGGTYVGENRTIGEVIRMQYDKHASVYEKSLEHLAELIPRKYRIFMDAALFFFWAFLFMTFLRVFTFTGYGRSLRISLLSGGVTYYFMPDVSPGRGDDLVFLGAAAAVIITRLSVKARKKYRKDKAPAVR